MTNDSLPTLPRWFRVWRASIATAVVLVILTAAAAVPLILSTLLITNSESTVQLALQSDLHNSLLDLVQRIEFLWTRSLFVAGFVLWIASVAIGTAFMLRSQTRKGVSWRQFFLSAAPIPALFFIALVLLALDGPLSATIYGFGAASSECSYKIMVVAFDDLNGNGVRDTGEPGVAQIKATLKYISTGLLVTPDRSVETDDSGNARLERYDYACNLTGDRLSVSVDLSPNYTTDSPLSFGPFALTKYPTEPPLEVIYVGFRKQ